MLEFKPGFLLPIRGEGCIAFWKSGYGVLIRTWFSMLRGDSNKFGKTRWQPYLSFRTPCNFTVLNCQILKGHTVPLTGGLALAELFLGTGGFSHQPAVSESASSPSQQCFQLINIFFDRFGWFFVPAVTSTTGWTHPNQYPSLRHQSASLWGKLLRWG